MAEEPTHVGSQPPAWLLFVIPILVAAVALGVRELPGPRVGADNVAGRSEPVDVAASGPRFGTVAELAEVSDLIVLAEVTGKAPGRAVTDPADPQSGILTTVFTLAVVDSVPGVWTESGDRPGDVTLEYETALLDGTPITIDGVEPPAVGELGLFFLIDGPSQDFPHYGLVNGQGRYPIDSDRSLMAVSGDPLVVELAGQPVEQLWRSLAD